MQVKTRFCPSPTGRMHLGNYRTALLSWLLAKSKQGKFLLRIEDTDLDRSLPEYAEQLQEDLLALGLQWDEGPGIGENAQEYFQSNRSEVYSKIYEQLLAGNKAYHCFCSPEQLKAVSKQQLASGQPPKYLGTCRSLSAQEVADKFAVGAKASLRFVVPNSQQVIFDDALRSTQAFNSDDLGDFIIRKTNGTPSFMFCNAVDDALMGVTNVLRGEDHLTNTPRQLLILQELKMQVADYAHISVILGADGSPLSKRNGSMSMQDLLAQGYLPIAINNYIARLGNSSYAECEHLLSLEELAAKFDLANLSKSAAKFDIAQLNHWQKKAVLSLELQEFSRWLQEHIDLDVPSTARAQFFATMAQNIFLPIQAKQWCEILFANKLLELSSVKMPAEASFFLLCYDLASQADSWEAFMQDLKQQSSIKGKQLFQSLRLALSGLTYGPELKVIFNLMSREQVISRFKHASQNS